MPRFYCSLPLTIGASVTLPDSVTHHLHVLRLGLNEPITLFNGEGGEYVATLTMLNKRRADAQIKAFSPREVELPYAMTLAQALPEGPKMDWIIEKAVELGATAIQPLAAQRSVIKLSAERAEKKLSHWERIIIAAAEQSGRNRLPHLTEPADFKGWVTQRDLHHRILLTPRAELSLTNWARHQPSQAVTLIVGPEGGFTEQEEEMAYAHNIMGLSIGSRILRTETAGLTAITILNAIWGAF